MDDQLVFHMNNHLVIPLEHLTVIEVGNHLVIEMENN